MHFTTDEPANTHFSTHDDDDNLQIVCSVEFDECPQNVEMCYFKYAIGY